MNYYSLGAIVSLILFGMAVVSLFLGIQTYKSNGSSKSGRRMFYLFFCVFAWDTGYAWMGLCHGDVFAYVPRAIALTGVFFYMPIALIYISELFSYEIRYKKMLYFGYFLFGTPTWFCVIRKSSVTFEETPWGYWYTSSMNWGRIVQFILIILTLFFYYYILRVCSKNIQFKREKEIIKNFKWFGPILITGCALDTLLPTIFHTAAIPGSAVGAFGSAILLYKIAEKYRAFGASITNVSEYVFHEVDVPVLVGDHAGKLVLYNDVAPSFLGRSREDLIGLSKEDLFDKHESKMKLSDNGSAELYVVKGTSTICKLEKTIVNDEFGDVLFNIIFVQDVSDTQRALEMMSESKKVAEEANASKSAFLANMSHEIRTPMNAIMGMSDILLQSNSSAGENKNLIENIKQSGSSLLDIINDLLDISRLESGKYELVESKYSVPNLICSVNSIIKVRIAETPLEYEISISPDCPIELVGDELRVKQILLNLLGNAIKFTEKGSVGLKLWMEDEGDKKILCADIKDTGIGIRDEDLAKVFDDFQQVDTHRNRNKQGSGLGLAISRGLAKLMGGDISVESVYGIGTVFHLRVVQGVSDTKTIGEELAKAIERDEYEPNTKDESYEVIPKPGKTVLIVDDSKINLMVAKGLMTPYELSIDVASSGKQAIEMVKQKDYDLIFMDHMMPELDGVETTHLIREIDGEKYKTVPIVALTANAITGTREQLMAEGMQEFITKPINKKELNKILDQFLGTE